MQYMHTLVPDSQEGGAFPGRSARGLLFEAHHVVDGEHGGGHEVGQAEDRVDYHQHGNDQKVQVVARAFLYTII